MKKFFTAAAVIVATVGSMLVTAPAAEAQYGYYGAIAVSRSGAYGIANNYGSYAEAENAAVGVCGAGCYTLVSWTNGCGVLASNRSYWSGAARASYSAARSAALGRLSGGWVVDWRCTSGYSL
ncbi:DUF4189 domain-containing protein [Nocardia puris]|uniref:Uncharacterized protein DUF4189 n=1 Tax=Nocardia puris TaxID=208602 RepID=A0A366E2G2_9NOCA|nr:DUF4189 domain-containing protein [Nocardia puris]MBF6212617.1 DUF4189 domain-containing protein [Nocardia puris]MBF6369197.1 DUF4189 domain-containing protein [Nocardia puris]MBF6461206.1 DUF4189 domain-containing protein [Nocardia puris]RBO96566.1 uncharacterized protein DUF4189 [Nocardia puris]